ncbi:hypothetical protein HPP92_020876 [Vanilla planifolia]|uniref:Protein kinase domain-containing protein n=1 Tax=Vanilla planifolia TaxID=51239 RepID=A0A835UIW8_VANPL|nr:hypothetical protein HPP92_020876 [Vanilla planifolia]
MVAVVLLLLVTACVFLTMEIIIYWFVLHRRQRNNFRRGAPFGKNLGMNPHYSAMIRLSLEEVKELTKNFGFKLAPNLYRGMLPNKMPVAVKVLGDIAVSEKDFMLLVSTLGGTHHRNLVSLKGFCYEPQHKLLVYEYIKNGSLDQWLFNAKQCRSRDGWHLRLNISIGIARALAYLHIECKQCIPHGNLKLKNVLLDENMVAKVNSYGLHSLLLEGVSSSSETLLEKDVYMLGLILLQIFSGNRSMADHKLHDLAYHKCKSGKLFQFVDPFLPSEEVQLEGIERVIRLALWCMQSKPSSRPSIGEVVMVLEGALSVDMPPEHDELIL